jgi:succinate dehydrogenase / fumarate reductase, membrane anchor subunit
MDMVKRVVVGAHYGLRDWLAQRVSAVIMALYTVMLAGYALAHRPLGYEQWKGMFAAGALRVLTLLFFFSLFYHAWVGVRDILMDYIKNTALRLVLEIIVIVVLVAYTIWTISILWGV